MGKKTDEALVAAIEGMEKIWELRQADKSKERHGQGEQKAAPDVVLAAFIDRKKHL